MPMRRRTRERLNLRLLTIHDRRPAMRPEPSAHRTILRLLEFRCWLAMSMDEEPALLLNPARDRPRGYVSGSEGASAEIAPRRAGGGQPGGSRDDSQRDIKLLGGRAGGSRRCRALGVNLSCEVGNLCS
jgi:hypothetical protein